DAREKPDRAPVPGIFVLRDSCRGTEDQSGTTGESYRTGQLAGSLVGCRRRKPVIELGRAGKRRIVEALICDSPRRPMDAAEDNCCEPSGVPPTGGVPVSDLVCGWDGAGRMGGGAGKGERG